MDPLKGVISDFLYLVNDDSKEKYINKDGRGNSGRDYFKASQKKGSEDLIDEEPVIKAAGTYEKKKISFEREPVAHHPDFEARREIMRDALRAIRNNPASSEKEKRYARLDIDFEKFFSNLETESIQETLSIRISVETITSILFASYLGAIGKPLKNILNDSIRELIEKYIKIKKQRKKPIEKKDKEASKPAPPEEPIKKLGSEFEKILGKYEGGNFNSRDIMDIVLNEIVSATPGPINRLIATITKETVKKVSRHNRQAGSELAEEGFKAIISNPVSTEYQKKMAKLGIDYSSYNLSPAKKLNKRIKALDKIIDLPDENEK
jgi:hypothetical protein